MFVSSTRGFRIKDFVSSSCFHVVITSRCNVPLLSYVLTRAGNPRRQPRVSKKVDLAGNFIRCAICNGDFGARSRRRRVVWHRPAVAHGNGEGGHYFLLRASGQHKPLALALRSDSRSQPNRVFP